METERMTPDEMDAYSDCFYGPHEAAEAEFRRWCREHNLDPHGADVADEMIVAAPKKEQACTVNTTDVTAPPAATPTTTTTGGGLLNEQNDHPQVPR